MSDRQCQEEPPSDFARIMNSSCAEGQGPAVATRPPTARIEVDAEKTRNGLGQLVLTVVKLVHELLEKQAIRRMDAGTLSDEEVERLGLALLAQSAEIERLRQEFHLEEEDLNIDLGPLGKLLK